MNQRNSVAPRRHVAGDPTEADAVEQARIRSWRSLISELEEKRSMLAAWRVRASGRVRTCAYVECAPFAPVRALVCSGR